MQTLPCDLLFRIYDELDLGSLRQVSGSSPKLGLTVTDYWAYKTYEDYGIRGGNQFKYKTLGDERALEMLAGSSKKLQTSVDDYWEDRVRLKYGIYGGDKSLYQFLAEREFRSPAAVNALEYCTQHRDTERYAEIISASGFASDQALRNACLHEQVQVVANLLASDKVNPAVGANYCIQTASHLGNAAIVKLLLQQPKVNPAADDNNAIIMAAKLGRTEVVRLLLADSRVNCRARGGEAMRMAKMRKRVEIVELLSVEC
jgi:hypothetical protein